MGPLAPPATLGVAMQLNLDHRTDSVEDLSRDRAGDVESSIRL